MSVSSASFEALGLLFSADQKLWSVIWSTLVIALSALAIATPVALTISYYLATNNFKGKGFIVASFHALLATPTVVVGLVLFLLLSANGPLGALELLFTAKAVALGQFVIALPILVAFSYASFEQSAVLIRETAVTLGASKLHAFLFVIKENKHGLLASVLAGFGRIISEIGCALLVGGNIAGVTRTIPTAIALDTSKGKFAEGIALGVVLLALALLSSILLHLFQSRHKK